MVPRDAVVSAGGVVTPVLPGLPGGQHLSYADANGKIQYIIRDLVSQVTADGAVVDGGPLLSVNGFDALLYPSTTTPGNGCLRYIGVGGADTEVTLNDAFVRTVLRRPGPVSRSRSRRGAQLQLRHAPSRTQTP